MPYFAMEIKSHRRESYKKSISLAFNAFLILLFIWVADLISIHENILKKNAPHLISYDGGVLRV